MELLNVASLAVVSTFFAFLAETIPALVLGPLFDNIPFLRNLKWLLYLIALALGQVFAIHYQIDIPSALINALGGAHAPELHGMIFSGFGIGGGAIYLKTWFDRFFPQPYQAWTGRR